MRLSTPQQLTGCIRPTRSACLVAPHFRRPSPPCCSLSDAEPGPLAALFGSSSDTDEATAAAVSRAVKAAVAQNDEELQQLRAVVAELKSIADGTRLTAEAVGRVEAQLVRAG